MNVAIKSALLSALVLPGLGQIYLKYYKRGLLYALPTIVYVCFLSYKIIVVFRLVLDKITTGYVMINYEALMHEIKKATESQNLFVYQIIGYLVVACWVISIFDAYYLGLKTTQS